MPLHIKATDLDTILQIFARELPDVEVLAFGSRTAEIEPNPEADLDLAIVGEGIISSERMITIERSFAEAGLPFAVDAFDYAKLTSKLKGLIEKESIAIKKMEKN
jgi:predicted nucleotidyltransferase